MATSERPPRRRGCVLLWLAALASGLPVCAGMSGTGQSIRLCVLPLRGDATAAADADGLGHLVSFIANRTLAAVPTARVPTVEELEATTVAMGQGLGLVDTPNEARMVGAELQCRLVGYGAIRVLDDDAIIDIEVVDVAERKPVLQQSIRCSAAGPGEPAERVAERMAAAAGLPPFPPDAVERARPGTGSAKAVDDFGRALQAWDRDLGAEGMGLTELAHESLSRCTEYLASAVRADAAFSWPYGYLGRASTRILEIDADNVAAYSNLALASRHVRDYAAAIAALGEAIRLQPQDAQLHISLGDVLLDMALASPGGGRQSALTDAVRALQTAVRLQPTNAAAHNNLAAAFFYLSRFREAADEYQRATILAPGAAAGYLGLGLCRARLGQTDSAKQALRRATELDDGDLGAQAQRELDALG